jgi:hypothetical protein
MGASQDAGQPTVTPPDDEASGFGAAEGGVGKHAEVHTTGDVGVDPAAEMVVKYSPSGKNLSVGVEVSLVSTHLPSATPDHLREPSGPSGAPAVADGGGGAEERKKLSREEAKALRRAKAEVPPPPPPPPPPLPPPPLPPPPSLFRLLPLARSLSVSLSVCLSCVTPLDHLPVYHHNTPSDDNDRPSASARRPRYQPQMTG